MTVIPAVTWEPPASMPRDELVRRSEQLLARPEIPFDVVEDVFRVEALDLDWDIGGEVFTPRDPSQLARGPDGRKLAFFMLHGGAGDHRTRRTAARLLCGKLGFKVVTMTYPGRLNFRDPNRDWPGDTIDPDGSVRTPLWQLDEEIGPDQYDVVQVKDDPVKRAKWGTLFFARAKPASRFYDRMAAWPIAFETALLESCRRNLPPQDGWAVLATGQSTGGPFAHILLQRVENVIGLAGLETSQWGSIGATTQPWGFPFNYLTIRTWRHIAKYLGPEAGEAGARRLPWLIEEVFEAWDRVKTQPQFKAEYFVSFGDLPALAEAARAAADRLGLAAAETEALVERYHNLTRPLTGPGVPPVPPLLYEIAQNSVDHNVERYREVLFGNLARLDRPPKARAVVLEAGVHANDQPEAGLPLGILPAGAHLWNEAIQEGFFQAN